MERTTTTTAARRLVAPIALAAMLSTVGAPSLAQEGSPAVADKPNIVLVHGAWADGSSWGDVIAPLQADGYDVTAVQLPLTSVPDDVATLLNVLSLQDGPTLVAAHSYGGFVISALPADAPNVIGLVYVAAFAPDEGESGKALTSVEPPPPGFAALRPDAAGNVWLDPDGFLEFFMPDVDAARARVFEAAQKPVSGATFQSEEPFPTPAWRSFPTWYLVATQDQIIPPDGQRLFAQRMGATVSEVESGHVPLVSQPGAVIEAITSAADTLSGKAAS
jgi:pimeloyl-ACP methyl ester carboxylesterase